MISNIGNSVGLAIAGVIASSVMLAEKLEADSQAEMLTNGYMVTFWVCFGGNILVLVVIAWGLRKIGKVGIKTD